MKKLHPNAKALFFVTSFLSILPLIVIVVFAIIGIEFEIGGSGAFAGTTLLIMFFVVALLSLIIAHLTYENYGYELQKDRIYIQRGILWKRYVSIPYDRVQNVDVLRGPLARLFELSDLQIQTAGAVALVMEGRIPGISVEDADEVRDRILDRVSKDQGL